MNPDWLIQAGLRATLLLGGAFLLWRFLPVSKPGLRRRVLLGIAAGLLAAPWLSGWWEVEATPAPVLSSQTAGSFSPVDWATPAAWIWLGGSLIAMVRLGMEARALHRLIRHARPWSGSPALPDEITILQSSAISGPCVARGRKPVLLIPDSALGWSPPQWQMVLAHERQHLHQQDLRLSWLPRLVYCFYWWHPLAHWLKRQFHAESEVLCDRAVLAHSGYSPREYVEFLLSLNSARMPALAAGMPLKSPLGQRIERLLPSRQNPSHGWTGGLALLILSGIAVLSFSLRTLPPDGAADLPSDKSSGGASKVTPVDTAAGETALRLTANPFPGDDN